MANANELAQAKKRDRFERYATKRVSEALKKIKLVGKLADPSKFDYTKDEVEQMLEALYKEVRQVRAQFSSSEEREELFKFKKEEENESK